MPKRLTPEVQVPAFIAARRRHFSRAEKLALLTEAYERGDSISSVGRRYDIAVGLLFRWQRELGLSRDRLAATKAATQKARPPKASRQLQLDRIEKRIDELVVQNAALLQRLMQMAHSSGVHANTQQPTHVIGDS